MAENRADTHNGERTTISLAPETASASAARHFVSDVLQGHADPNVVETAVLLVSELVTNAVLHAGSPIQLTVLARGPDVRIEVHDESSVAPSRKNYSDDAGTGRGLLLVEAMASAWGSDSTSSGKVVWFEVAATAEDEPAGTAEPAMVEVHVLNIPLDIHRRTTEHHDELMREFALILDRDPEGRRAVPGQLLELIQELQGRYQNFTMAARGELQAALDRGDVTVDVVYTVPDDIGPAVTRLREILDAADDYCRAGADLLTLASPPEAVSFRNWFLGEFRRQSAGQPPRPWTSR